MVLSIYVITDTGPGDDPPRHMSALVEEYDDPQDDLSRWNTLPSDGSLLEGPLTRSTAGKHRFLISWTTRMYGFINTCDYRHRTGR